MLPWMLLLKRSREQKRMSKEKLCISSVSVLLAMYQSPNFIAATTAHILDYDNVSKVLTLKRARQQAFKVSEAPLLSHSYFGGGII